MTTFATLPFARFNSPAAHSCGRQWQVRPPFVRARLARKLLFCCISTYGTNIGTLAIGAACPHTSEPLDRLPRSEIPPVKYEQNPGPCTFLLKLQTLEFKGIRKLYWTTAIIKHFPIRISSEVKGVSWSLVF